MIRVLFLSLYSLKIYDYLYLTFFHDFNINEFSSTCFLGKLFRHNTKPSLQFKKQYKTIIKSRSKKRWGIIIARQRALILKIIKRLWSHSTCRSIKSFPRVIFFFLIERSLSFFISKMALKKTSPCPYRITTPLWKIISHKCYYFSNLNFTHI